MKININDNCKVKLTNYGISLLKKDPVNYEYNFDKENKILNTQVWVLMNIFGDYFYNGCDQIFIDNIIEV